MRSVLDLAGGRRGHFRMESGLHSGLWFDLEALFADAAAITPFVEQLASSLRSYDVEATCGPAVGGAKLAELVATSLGCEYAFTERADAETRGLFKARYVLPPAFAGGLRGKRVAIVDDVMSAGSSLRATHAELEAHGARPVVIGALYVLGSAGHDYFLQRGLSVETTGRASYEMWPPEQCPLCAAGAALEDAGALA